MSITAVDFITSAVKWIHYHPPSKYELINYLHEYFSELIQNLFKGNRIRILLLPLEDFSG